jgi:hypothetical protein
MQACLDEHLHTCPVLALFPGLQRQRTPESTCLCPLEVDAQFSRLFIRCLYMFVCMSEFAVVSLQEAAVAKYQATPGYGFAGDATNTVNNKYYGYLIWDGF